MPRRSGRHIAAALIACLLPISGAGGREAVRVLGPDDCEALAARNSTAATLLGRKRLEDAPRPSCLLGDRDEAARAVRGELLHLAALEARNRSAGAALELYHRLAGAEARRGLAARGIAEVDEALAQVAAIKGRGLASKVDEGALLRRRLEIEGDALDLDLARERLRGELATLLKLGPGPWALGPPTFAADEGPPDPPSAIALGLACRPELRLLRLLRATLDAGTARAARLVLAEASPILAAGPPAARGLRAMLGHSRGLDDLGALRGQLGVFLADRERAVAEEITQAASAIRVRREQVEVARRLVESWESEVSRAEQRRARGLATFAEAISPRAGLLKARDALVGREVERDLARVRLRQAQGGLGRSAD